MRITYPISYETFVALQPPFKAIEPMRGAVGVFAAIATLCVGVGFILLTPHLFPWIDHSPPRTNLVQAIGLISVSVISLLCVRVGRRISERRTLAQQEDFLRDSYSRLHCRDRRFVETTEEGLLIGCDCKEVLRPWALLTTMAETDKYFALCTNMEVLNIPKAAFSSEGDRTEFRAVLAQHLTGTKPATARPVEFACTSEDWRKASWLQFKTGGWARVASLVYLLCVVPAFGLFLVPYFDLNAENLSASLVVGACIYGLALLLAMVLSLRPKNFRHGLPTKVSFAEDAIYVEYPVAEARIPWTQVTGCIADKKSLLLGQRDKSVILIPQRCIAPAQREYIMQMLRAKIGSRAR
jgi:YcxB-like protein